MKTKRYFKSILLTLLVSGVCMQPLAGAQEISSTQPTYLTSAKAQQAAHIAEQEAHTTNPSLQTALTHLNEVEGQMGNRQRSDNLQQMTSAEKAINTAENNYVDMLSQMSGVSAKDINDMHTSGVSWSDIPNELGMHTMNGKMTGSNSQGEMQQRSMDTAHNVGDSGQKIGARTAEIMAATARNTESGWAEGHGAGIQTDEHGTKNAGMMSGAGGLSNGMGSAGKESHDGGMTGGIGVGEGGGHGGRGSDGGEGGGHGGGGSESGGGGGHGGGSGSGGGGGHGGGGGGMM